MLHERLIDSTTAEIGFWKLYPTIRDQGIAYGIRSHIDSEFGSRIVNTYRMHGFFPKLLCVPIEMSVGKINWIFVDQSKYELRVFDYIEPNQPEIVRSKIEGFREVDPKKIYPNSTPLNGQPSKILFIKKLENKHGKEV